MRVTGSLFLGERSALHPRMGSHQYDTGFWAADTVIYFGNSWCLDGSVDLEECISADTEAVGSI